YNIAINKKLRLVYRLQWLAQPPIEQPDPLKTPVALVMVQHTATEPCYSLAQCIFHVKTIQKYHIESNHWWDIGYNFLVGGDGAAYEGRGWTQEAHTPSDITTRALELIVAFNKLIEKGVELNYIQKDYKILAARQLYGTESPGTAFFNEILTQSETKSLRILSRIKWIAQPPTKVIPPLKTPVSLIVIHHTITESCTTEGACIYIVRQIQQYHIESRQLWDISYNFLVGADSRVYEARGLEERGAHTLILTPRVLVLPS
ncbi:hypothetical protein NQ317_000488, partial [Molorchus minor]